MSTTQQPAHAIPILPEVERVSTSVIRILGGNPGKFTLQGTNTYLISPPDSSTRLLLDTGQGSSYPSWSAALRRTLASESARLGREVRVTQCVLSHWHHDHVGGVHELRRICAGRNDAVVEEGGHKGLGVKGEGEGEALKIYKYPLLDDNSPDPSFPSNDQNKNHRAETSTREREDQLLRSANDDQDVGPIDDLEDGQILHVGSPRSLHSPDSHSEPEPLTLQVLHTPGHTSDHVALLITSSPDDPGEEGIIFTGDAVLGHGTAVFEDLARYMGSLHRMRDAVKSAAGFAEDRKGREEEEQEKGEDGENSRDGSGSGSGSGERKSVKMALPAHGAVIPDARAKIEEYISHRAMREREVLDVLAAGGDGDGGPAARPHHHRTSDTGERAWTSTDIVKVVYADIPESLHVAAEGGVVQLLQKLEAEGTVEKTEMGTGTGIQMWRISSTGTGTTTGTTTSTTMRRRGRRKDLTDEHLEQGRDKAAL